MEKMKLETANVAANNVERIGELFPNCITESKDENGQLKRAINFELLHQMLSEDVVDGKEAYEFTWVGKKASIVEANKPIRKTLRPCKEDSVNWDTTENLYIEGDNLQVLKLLQESYLGKVKMIYIDPPYNTGNDFIYNDDFKMDRDDYSEEMGEYDEEGNRMFKNVDANGRFHSDWCSMIYSRLLLTRNLLCDDGIIFISINDSELSSLINICGEVFGQENIIATLIWDKSVSAQSGIYKVYHEYILAIAKNIKNIKVPRSLDNDEFEAAAIKKVSGRHPASLFTFPKGTKFNAPDGTTLSGKVGDTINFNIIDGKMVAKNNKLVEDVTIEAGFTQINQMKQYFYGDKEKLVDSNGQKIVEFFFNSTGKIQVKKIRGVESPQTTCNFGTQASASNALATLFELDEPPFSSPKPIEMLLDFIRRFTSDDDIILDFFSGSGTTAHSTFLSNAMDGANRKFILVQIQEDLDFALSKAQKDAVNTLKVAIEYLETLNVPHVLTEIGKERIRRAGQKILSENQGIENLDIGFRVLKLDDTNMKDVYYAPQEYTQDALFNLAENVKEDRTGLDLLFGCLLEWGLPLSMPYSSDIVDDYTIHNYNNGDLIACFDEAVPDHVIRYMAKLQPLRVVFRDNSFIDSPAKINVGEIFKSLAPDTRIKVI